MVIVRHHWATGILGGSLKEPYRQLIWPLYYKYGKILRPLKHIRIIALIVTLIINKALVKKKPFRRFRAQRAEVPLGK